MTYCKYQILQKMKKLRWKKCHLAIIPIAKKKIQSLLPCTVLYCTVLCCTALHCTVLYLYMKSKLKELQCHKAVPLMLHKFLSNSLCCIMNEYISHFNKLRALS